MPALVSPHALSTVHVNSEVEQVPGQAQFPAGAGCVHCTSLGRWLSGTRPTLLLPEPQPASAVEDRTQKTQQPIPGRNERVMAASGSSRKVISKFEAKFGLASWPVNKPDGGQPPSEF